MLTEIKFKCYPEVAHALEWWSQYLDQGEGVDAAGKAAHNILLRILSEPEQLREILKGRRSTCSGKDSWKRRRAPRTSTTTSTPSGNIWQTAHFTKLRRRRWAIAPRPKNNRLHRRK